MNNIRDPKQLEIWISKAESDPNFAKSGQLERWKAELEAHQTITITEAPQHTLETRLSERGISENTALIFDIRPNGNGWEYPVPNGGDARRWKAYNSQQDPKYKWIPNKPQEANYYHAADLLGAVQANSGACWMASGEPDVWAMHSAGVEYVFSAGYGESHVPDNLSETLQSMGVITLYIAPDRDDAGQKWARKVAARLEGSGIDLDVRELPSSLGDGGDLGKAWETYTRESWPFERWLLGLPRIEIKPEKENKRTPPTIAAGDIPEAYRMAIADALDVSNFGSDGFSTKNVCCPFHSEERPSASLHQIKGLYCHHSGEWYKWTEIGKAIDVGSLSMWLAKHPDQGRFAVLALSTETREALIKSGLSTIARLYDALYLAGFTPGESFTIQDAMELCKPLGISQWAIRQTIAKDAERNNYLYFFPPLTLQHSQPEKNTNNSKRGPKDKIYKLLSPPEVAELAGVGGRMYHHYDPMPAENLAKISTYRAEVYAALPKRLPGNYSRQRLASRLGVTTRTTQNYDEIAGVKVTARYDKKEMEIEDIEQLPEDRKDAPAGSWLEDETGKRYQPTKAGAEFALKWSSTIFYVKQLTNSYGPETVED